MSDVDGRRVFFDTNVIVYTYDEDAPSKRDVARMMMKDSLVAQTGVVSGQVLGETYVTLTKKLKIPVEDARELASLMT